MTAYDYAVLGLYFAYMLAVSWVFRRFVRGVGDYFRSGGQVLWWMSGGSAFMASFSAWTFTGGASRAYGDGWPIAAIYLGNALGFLVAAFYFAPRFRQLRVITAMEAVRARFGAGNEQFFTWLNVVLRTIYAAIWLYGLGVFFSAAFRMDATTTILLAGGTVMAIALLGGSWAVVASDFIQVLILMPVTAVATVLAIGKLGGVSAFAHALAPTKLNLGKFDGEAFLPLWCAAMLVKQVFSTNSLSESARFLCVKDSRHARKSALLAAALMLAGVVCWFVPPMAASVTHPDIARVYPGLNTPGEGSYFAIAMATFPVGMLGLLVSGVFAATMSAMDVGLNSNAGFFIKNFYQPILRPGADEQELLMAGKTATLVLGAAIISLAQVFRHTRELTLFNLMLDVSTLFALPLIVPLVLGIVVRRTPAWSGWSTALVGLATSLLTRRFLTAEWAVRTFGARAAGLGDWGRENWDVGIGVFTIVGAGSAWFLLTRLFYRGAPEAYRGAIDAFCRRIEKPVDYEREEPAAASDSRQSRLIGWLCLPYGAIVCLLALIPNNPGGRAAFVFCGGVAVAVGILLVRSGSGGARPAARKPQPVDGLMLALSLQETGDFLPEPLLSEVRGMSARCLGVNGDFHRSLAEADPEVLVACWSTPPLPEELPPRLRYVCYLAGSVKKLVSRRHIERGLMLTNWGGSVSRVVAEGALMLAVSALRRSGYWISAMHSGAAPWKNGRVEIASLFERRVGLHGFGYVARELIRLLKPFGVEVGVCAPETDPALYAAHGVDRIPSIEELFSGYDVIVELAPLIPATEGIVTERLLRLIRPGGAFVNVGRGRLVDEAALVRVAREGRIQIALDVYAIEPLPADSGLRGLPNVILLPHLSGPTTDRQQDAGAFGLRNLRAYAAGLPLEALVTLPVYDQSS